MDGESPRHQWGTGGRIWEFPGLRCGFHRGLERLGGGGCAEVADDAGGGPGIGEALAGFGLAEAEDQAVHAEEEIAHFAEFRAQGGGECLAAGNGGGGIGGDFFEVVGFLGEGGGGVGVEAVGEEGGGIGGEGGAEVLVEQAGLGDEIGVAEALPGAE